LRDYGYMAEFDSGQWLTELEEIVWLWAEVCALIMGAYYFLL